MHKKGTGEETYFSYKEKNTFFKKKREEKKILSSNTRKFWKRLHRDVELDFRSNRTGNLQI